MFRYIRVSLFFPPYLTGSFNCITRGLEGLEGLESLLVLVKKCNKLCSAVFFLFENI